jgi:hypothetical protein
VRAAQLGRTAKRLRQQLDEYETNLPTALQTGGKKPAQGARGRQSFVDERLAPPQAQGSDEEC